MEEGGGKAGMKTVLVCIFIMALLIPSMVCAKPAAQTAAAKDKQAQSFDLFRSVSGSEGGRSLINIVLVLTVIAFAPAILLLMSCFTRIIIVLSFLRQAMGVTQLPPNQILIGLSLFLTFFIMAPTYEKIHEKALAPYMSNKMNFEEFIGNASDEMRVFMMKFTKEKDLALFMNIAGLQRPATEKDIPMRVLIPSFAISELKRAFQIGFLLYIPFLVIDMVVASVLLSAGMMMLPPIFVSMPFKLMLFVLVDGWNLIVGSLIKSFY